MMPTPSLRFSYPVCLALGAILLPSLLGGCGKAVADGNANSTAVKEPRVKIAFLVKQPDEPWFQLEWKFASEAAQRDGFDLITKGVSDPTQVSPTIQRAAESGARGLVICSPDVKLGPEIASDCRKYHLKLLTVDDQLIGTDGRFLTVPHLGISARKIGCSVGEALMDQMKRKGWQASQTGMLLVTDDGLNTAKERTDGAAEATTRAGLDPRHVFRSPLRATDIPAGKEAAAAVLSKHPEMQNWLVAGMNDPTVIGAVRATEEARVSAAHVVAIGINGDSALYELKKYKPTGFYGSILLQAKRHGCDTAEMMYKWIHDGVQPPKITYTDGILITRENFRKVLKDQGLPQ